MRQVKLHLIFLCGLIRKPKNKFIVGYTGTLGVANALDSLIEAAELLKNQADIIFILVGGGREKENLATKPVYYQM
jgi:hypothetical protein